MNQEKSNSRKCPICGRPTHKTSKYCIFHALAEEKTYEDFKQALKDYIEGIKKKNKAYNFKYFIFVGDINFRKDFNITVIKEANFSMATFGGKVIFSKITFKEDASFESVKFKGSNISFYGATFNGSVNFNLATFNGKTDFACTTFNWETIFSMITIEKEVDFLDAIFNEEAYFFLSTFKDEADFSQTTFKKEIDFSNAIFQKNVNFYHATFNGKANFSRINFEGGVFFSEVTFEREANYIETYFKGVADFCDAIFKKIANFNSAEFFSSNHLKGAIFKEDLIFCNSLLPIKNDLFLKVKGNGLISFNHTCLDNIFLELELDKQVQIDFSDSILRNTKIRKKQIENHIYQETYEHFSWAKEVYLLLKNNFHTIGRYDDESWAFIKERDMERLDKSFYGFIVRCKKIRLFKKIISSANSNLLKRVIVQFRLMKRWIFSKKMPRWLILSLSNFIYQYGENFWRVVRFALIVIFLFAGLLDNSGMIKSNNDLLVLQNIQKMQEDGLLVYSGPIVGNFLNCLYFSVVTFTTLGYGDFQPLEGWSRFWVSSEALIGAFTMALFVYTFARRTGGR